MVEKAAKWDTKREVKYAFLILLIGWSIMIPAIILTPKYVKPHAFFSFHYNMGHILYNKQTTSSSR